jgi:integral membrane protein
MQKNWYQTALGRFRTIAIAEGISFLILLLIAMPLKYVAGIPEAVMVIGWLHGLLFISYMIAGLDVRKTHQWGAKKVATAVIAAFIPFGPFILDRKILQPEME